jgi:hypothetical protein
LAATLVIGCIAFVAPSAASAATIAVTSNADSGAGTLRAALASAAPGDTVTVPAMTITLTSGALRVSNSVTIQGAGARATTISGGNNSGAFELNAAGAKIEGLTITQGRDNSGFGGVDARQGVTLSDDAIVYNTGGGVYAWGGPLVIDHSLIAHNQAGRGGGIVYAGGPGATITDTTIADNTATDEGAGIQIYNNGLLTLDSDTLVDNVLTNPVSWGGNLYMDPGTTLQMGDTILAGGAAGQGGDCYVASGASWTSLGHNAEDTEPNPDSGCQSQFTGPVDHTGLTLKLGALQDNGGPTDTILPAAGSPVVDQGDPSRCLPDDQRGVSRPQGGGCDIGAVERSVAASFSGFADTLTTTGAVLHGTANTQGLSGNAYFLYGPTANFGASTANSALTATGSAQQVTATLTGLSPATTYYFALVVNTPDGTVTGPVEFLTTQAATVTTPGQPMPAICRVPKLKGDSLAKAKRVLTAAHCALGKVKRATRTHRKQVVVWQGFAAGTVHPTGFKVPIKLVTKPAKRHPADERPRS